MFSIMLLVVDAMLERLVWVTLESADKQARLEAMPALNFVLSNAVLLWSRAWKLDSGEISIVFNEGILSIFRFGGVIFSKL